MKNFEELIRRLDELYAKATPGEWRHSCYMSGTQNVEFPGSRGVTFVDRVMAEDTSDICTQDDIRNFIHVWHRPTDAGNDADPERTVNARLIAALHNAYPALRDALERMQSVLRAYEQWEADVVLTGDWSSSTVRLTQAQHDRLIEIQAMRNAAIDHDQPARTDIGTEDAQV